MILSEMTKDERSTLLVFEADDLFRELHPEALEFSFTGIVATGPTAYLKKGVPDA